MLLAVAAELGGDYRLAVEPWVGPYEDRARLGLYQRLSVRRLGPASELPAWLIPPRFRRLLGVVRAADVAGVVDASGFAYGDQWGPARTERAAEAATRMRRAGKRVVLLPQAFGPFSGARIRAAAGRLVEQADLVFARDRVSLAALHELGARSDHIALAPDFTNALHASGSPDEPTGGTGETQQPAYIVPNVKVLQHVDPAAGEAYVPFLAACVRAIEARGVRAVILVHESHDDEALARRLNDAVGSRLEVVGNDDPLALKALIGRSRLVVGSRFHALVAALSQAVPVVAVGWSHKYAELLDDYGAAEALVPMPAGTEEAEAAVHRALDEPERTRSVETLAGAAARQLELTHEMWRRVRAVLPDPASPADR
jgi:polysaccharide pyruvyl transferase WcaK-like protein